jgi:hypothetical protein
LRQIGNVPVRTLMDKEDVATYGDRNDGAAQMYLQRVASPGYWLGRIAQGQQMAGIANNLSDLVNQDRRDLAEVLETVLCGEQECQAETGANTPYKTRSILTWLSAIAQGTLPVPDGFRPSAASHYTGTLAEYHPEDLEAQLAAMHTDVKDRLSLLFAAGMLLRGRVSKWPYHVVAADGARGITKQISGQGGRKVDLVVEELTFDHGDVKLVTAYHFFKDLETGADTAYTDRSGVLIDPAKWALRYMDEPSWWEQPDLGGGPRGFHDCIAALVCTMPRGQGYVKVNS